MSATAGEIARMLAGRAEALCRELLPAGKRQGHEWVHPSLGGGSPRSLSVHLTGARAGVWADFAGDARGDALDLVAAVQFGGDKGQALRWARVWLGLGTSAPGSASTAAKPTRRPAAPADDAEELGRRRAARAIFLAAEPAIRDTPAAAYLAARGIDLGELARQPAALRFHPALWCREAGAKLPAMVAAISHPTTGHTAVHRTWLARDEAGSWRKAAVPNPKMTLGSYAGGTIRLWRGASGKPLAQAPATDTVIVAEGIENGLSAAIGCPQFRVLCAVSLANLGRIELPPQLLDVIVAADNDAPGSAAEAGLKRAVDRLLHQGRSVRLARSPVGKDFNDLLQSPPA